MFLADDRRYGWCQVVLGDVGRFERYWVMLGGVEEGSMFKVFDLEESATLI